MATKKTATGLPPEMPLAPGNRLAGEPAPKHVTAAHAVPPYLAPEKQKFTTPAPVSKVQGLQANTVLPRPTLRTIDGYYIQF
jgi:hypothetical protein